MRTVCLLAASNGLGIRILETAVRYPDIVRKYLHLPPEKKILVGIVKAHSDYEATINQFQSDRESLEAVVHWQDV